MTKKKHPDDWFDARALFELWEPDTPDETIAIALGVDRITVNKWSRGINIHLTPWRADKLAIRLGTHPSRIWGEHWWNMALATV